MYNFLISIKEKKSKIPEKKDDQGVIIQEAKEVTHKILFKSELRPVYT